MEFLIFLFVIVGIVIWFFVASEFASIARDKGYNNSKYFWYTLFFGIIGMLMIIALPNKNFNIGVVHNPMHVANDLNKAVDSNDLNSGLETKVEKTTYKNIDQNTIMWWYIKDIFRRLFRGCKK